MKILLTLFLSVLLAPFVLSSPVKWLGKHLVDMNKNSKCDNISHWKSFVDKAKKEHPTAKMEELVKFIGRDIMESSPRLMFTQVDFGDQSCQSCIIQFYTEFNGTSSELMKFVFRLYPIMECQIENNLYILVVVRHEASENGISLAPKRKFWRNDRPIIFYKKEIFEHFLGQTNENSAMYQSCIHFPKIQAIINKVNNMTTHNVDEWARLCEEEVVINLKPLYSFVSRKDFTTGKFTFVGEGQEKLSDYMHCQKNPTDPRCVACISQRGITGVSVAYLER